MTTDQWEMFFSLLDDITNLEMAATDKARLVEKMARENDSDTALDEFLGWFGGETEAE